MKSIVMACAVLVACAAAAKADEKVSKSTLNNMGLARMQQMSDSDGMAVRGKALDFTFNGFQLGNGNGNGLGGFSGFGLPAGLPGGGSSPQQVFSSIGTPLFQYINSQLPAGVSVPFPSIFQ